MERLIRLLDPGGARTMQIRVRAHEQKRRLKHPVACPFRIVHFNLEQFGKAIQYLLIILLFSVGTAGCAHYPTNDRLEKYDPSYGYKWRNVGDPEKSEKIFISLNFSGGGTRAAAFSYGVLEGLSKIEITLDGQKRRLIDEVDVITGVSGGSFTAAYYGLFGDRIFIDFEEKFLKKNIQGKVTSLLFLNPYNWGKLFSAYYDRSDLLAEYYDKYIFNGATFGDMMKRKGAMIFINATDMVHGTRVAFTQDSFDLICSDLSTFPVGRACAASSAVPVLFSPITLRNYAGSCGYKMPHSLERAMVDDRKFDLATNILPFLDAKKKPYIHLVDGGVSGNLGLRALIERVTMFGDAWTALQAGGLTEVNKVLIIIVNAETEIDTKWDRQETVPPFAAMLDSFSSLSISRYNIETVGLLREILPKWSDDVRRGRCAPDEIKQGPGTCGDIEFYMVEIKFDAIKDDEQRSYFNGLPTSFRLEADEVNKLREVAQKLLAESEDFERFLKDLEKKQ